MTWWPTQVGLWFADHSTPNPLGVKPDPDITKIVVGNKFSEEGIEIVWFTICVMSHNVNRIALF